MVILKDQIEFKSNIGNIYIYGKLTFLEHFKNEVYRYTKKVYLNKKASFERNDIIFSINNPKIFKKKILKRGTFINYHDSYLPYFKGLNSSTWSILKKNKHHGCTYHFIDATIDTGPIIYQKKMNILSYYNSHLIDLKNIYSGFELFKKILKDIFVKKKINYHHQSKKGKYFSKKDLLKIPLYGFIDLNWKIERISRHFKALKVSDFKKNFILTPKLLTKNNEIVDILDLKVIKARDILSYMKENKAMNKKFFYKKKNYLLEFETNKKIKSTKFQNSVGIKNYIKNKINNLKI